MYAIRNETISFDMIKGISPYNVRHDEAGDDLTSLKASIRKRGMIYRPLVHWDDEANGYFVIEGGRRWRAMREIVAEDLETVDFDVTIISGATPDELIALSATGNVLTRPMHPVREFEAFAAIAAALPGEDAAIEVIAKEFGLTRKQVRQRLALGGLSPAIRAAWLEGALDAEAARAYAECPDVAAQEAFFAAAPDDRRATPASIRKALLGDLIDANDPTIRFIGEDAYIQAGGEIRDSLFAEERRFSGALARKLAHEKLRAEAERIRQAEGWGFYVLPGDEGEEDYEQIEDLEPDYLPDEEKSLTAIRQELRDLDPTSPCALALTASADALEGLATQRALPAAERLNLGVFVDFDPWGGLDITRALVAPGNENAHFADGDDETGEFDEDDAPPAPAARQEAPPAPAPAEPIGKQLRTVLDETLAGALHDAAARSVNFALVLAVATLGCGYDRAALDLAMHPRRGWSPAHPLLRAIAHESLDKALSLTATAPLADLTAAFCELIGAAIDPSRALATEAGLRLVAAAEGLAAIEGDLKKHFDADAWFRAATKDAAIAAIRETEGEASAAEARAMKKPALIERAALVAKDFEWLPPVIRDALPQTGNAPAATSEAKPPAPDARTLAEAMADALAADGDGDETADHDAERLYRAWRRR